MRGVEQLRMMKSTHCAPGLVREQNPSPKLRLVEPLTCHALGIGALILCCGTRQQEQGLVEGNLDIAFLWDVACYVHGEDGREYAGSDAA
jgi:hypothetical protein